jgi:gamma-glutamylputrescine oxidase
MAWQNVRMKPNSHYHRMSNDTLAFDAFPARDQVPVIIVGGGFAGINTALSLAERGVRSIVLEAQTIGFGASGRNGGFVFAGYSKGEAALLKLLGPELAKAWYQRTVAAVNLIRDRIAREQIACEHTDAGVLWANVFEDDSVLQDRKELLGNYFDTHWQFLNQVETSKLVRSDRYTGALFERNAMHLNPLKLVRALARAAKVRGATVVENCVVQSVKRVGDLWQVETQLGSVQAKDVVFACGGYWQAQLAKSVPALQYSVMPIATYVMASAPLGDRLESVIRTKAAIYDSRFAFDYYRAMPDTRLLWGGRIHVMDASPELVKKKLRADMLRVFPSLVDLQIESAWSGMMSYARHEMPQIGQTPEGLWYAQAFGGHGLAPTCVAGEVLADALTGVDQRWRELAQFGLQRTFGFTGLAAAQGMYWYLQSVDAFNEWKRR